MVEGSCTVASPQAQHAAVLALDLADGGQQGSACDVFSGVDGCARKGGVALFNGLLLLNQESI